MRILLLSAYDAASHQRWREQLVSEVSEHEWVQLVLPARYFSWRIRGNSLSWAFEQREILEAGYDLILATSMVDLSSLRGFIPVLGAIPTIVYFHENQFAYPKTLRQTSSLEPKIINLYTALCADRIVFNSQYNADSFLAGVTALLKKLPDHVPMSALDQLSSLSQVIPVPLYLNDIDKFERAETFTLVWNHRWEYDKGVDRLLAFCEALIQCPIECHLHIVGEQFRQIPEALLKIKTLFSKNDNDSHRVTLRSFGFIKDVSEYQKVLKQSHLVLSTAIHDFQGLAVMDGVINGCRPVVPDRLAYQEIFSDEYRYPSVLDAIEDEALGMVQQVVECYKVWKKSPALLQCPELNKYCWTALIEDYRNLFDDCAAPTRK